MVTYVESNTKGKHASVHLKTLVYQSFGYSPEFHLYHIFFSLLTGHAADTSLF